MDATKERVLVRAGAAAVPSEDAPEVTALVRRAKAGEAEAFDDLMRLYERRVIALGIQMGLSKDDALDACQDAFVKVFRYIGSFDSERSFFKWLYRIAVHAVYDHLRRRRQPGTISTEEMEGPGLTAIAEQKISLETSVESADMRRKLLAGMDGLSRQERIVFTLRDLQEMDSVEVGRILKLSQITVRRHCMSARRKLRDRLLKGDA